MDGGRPHRLRTRMNLLPLVMFDGGLCIGDRPSVELRLEGKECLTRLSSGRVHPEPAINLADEPTGSS